MNLFIPIQIGGDTGIVTLLLALGIFLLVFFVLREVMLWYWRVNTSVKCQQAMVFLLKKIYENQSGTLTEEEKKGIELLLKS